MTDKTQTLAAKIRALASPYPIVTGPGLAIYNNGFNHGKESAAALADAAATTTPVVAAEQAGDVRQAVRVRLFVDDDGDICHEPRGADMNLVALPAIDDHDGRVMHPDLFKAMVDAYNAALEPDPTPATREVTAQEAAKVLWDHGATPTVQNACASRVRVHKFNDVLLRIIGETGQ